MEEWYEMPEENILDVHEILYDKPDADESQSKSTSGTCCYLMIMAVKSTFTQKRD